MEILLSLARAASYLGITPSAFTLLTMLLLLLLCLLLVTCCCHSYSHSCVLGRLLMALQISDPSCESWYLNTVTSSCTFS